MSTWCFLAHVLLQYELLEVPNLRYLWSQSQDIHEDCAEYVGRCGQPVRKSPGIRFAAP
jgi:hypothetical protein